MTVIQSEQVDDNDHTADGSTTAHEVEGEIREFVRRDLSVLRRPRPERSEAADNVNSLIQRVSGASVVEIERVIAELTSVRDMLRSEGERVQREITGYASLSQAAMTSMKIIADSLAQWNPRGAQVRQGNG
jgi:hypothetical protein